MKTLITLLTAIGAVALAACGGSGSKANLITASPATTSSPASSASAAPASSPSPTAAATNSPSASPATTATTAATSPAATATAAPPTATQPAAATAVPPTTAPPPTAPPPTPTEAPGAPLSASVGIDGTFFTPNRVVVAAGGSVSWSWSGDTFHDVTGIDFAAHSETAKSGALTVTFATPGTYRYKCSVHIGMRGTVEVQ